MVDIHKRSRVLSDLEKSGAIKIVGSMYNLETGLIEFFG
jgi:carbonic anhydrase